MKIKKKNILILFVALVVIILGVILGFVFRKEDNPSKDEEPIFSAAKDYFADTDKTEVSAQALIENGYLEKSENTCLLFALKDGQVVSSGEDCQKAEEYSKDPVLLLHATDDFIVNEWNTKGTVLSFSLKNGGNKTYQTEEIDTVTWFNETTGETFEGETLRVEKQNREETYLLSVSFKDESYVIDKRFRILIDQEVPVMEEYHFGNRNIAAAYRDFSGIQKIYYAVTEIKDAPKKEDMRESDNVKMECEKIYYGWSYAVDLAGNESPMQYLGEYANHCESQGSVGTSGGGTTSSKSKE